MKIKVCFKGEKKKKINIKKGLFRSLHLGLFGMLFINFKDVGTKINWQINRYNKLFGKKNFPCE